VQLLPDRIRLSKPRVDVSIHIGQCGETKVVHVVARRDGLDPAEARMFEPSSQYHVAVEPLAAGRYLGKRHPDLKGDARLLRQDKDGPAQTHTPEHGAVERPDQGRLAQEVALEVERGTGVGLIPIRESTAALRAAPQGFRRAVSHDLPTESEPGTH